MLPFDSISVKSCNESINFLLLNPYFIFKSRSLKINNHINLIYTQNTKKYVGTTL